MLSFVLVILFASIVATCISNKIILWNWFRGENFSDAAVDFGRVVILAAVLFGLWIKFTEYGTFEAGNVGIDLTVLFLLLMYFLIDKDEVLVFEDIRVLYVYYMIVSVEEIRSFTVVDKMVFSYIYFFMKDDNVLRFKVFKYNNLQLKECLYHLGITEA